MKVRTEYSSRVADPASRCRCFLVSLAEAKLPML